MWKESVSGVIETRIKLSAHFTTSRRRFKLRRTERQSFSWSEVRSHLEDRVISRKARMVTRRRHNRCFHSWCPQLFQNAKQKKTAVRRVHLRTENRTPAPTCLAESDEKVRLVRETRTAGKQNPRRGVHTRQLKNQRRAAPRARQRLRHRARASRDAAEPIEVRTKQAEFGQRSARRTRRGGRKGAERCVPSGSGAGTNVYTSNCVACGPTGGARAGNAPRRRNQNGSGQRNWPKAAPLLRSTFKMFARLAGDGLLASSWRT